MRYHEYMDDRLIRFSGAILLFFGFAVTPVLAANNGLVATPTCNISQSEWESPNRSQTLLADPALRQLLQVWSKHPKARLRVEYPGGEQGVIWANRLTGWLVAFGVPHKKIALFPGESDTHTLALSLQSSRAGR